MINTIRQIRFDYKIGSPYIVYTNFIYDVTMEIYQLIIKVMKLNTPIEKDTFLGLNINSFTNQLMNTGFSNGYTTISSPKFVRVSFDEIESWLRKECLFDLYSYSANTNNGLLFKIGRTDQVNTPMVTTFLKTNDFVTNYIGLNEFIERIFEDTLTGHHIHKFLQPTSFIVPGVKEPDLNSEAWVQTPMLKCVYTMEANIKGPRHILTFNERLDNERRTTINYFYKLQEKDVSLFFDWCLKRAYGLDCDNLIENKTIYLLVEYFLMDMQDYIVSQLGQSTQFVEQLLNVQLNKFSYDFPTKRGRNAYKLRRGYQCIKRFKKTGHFLNFTTQSQEMLKKGIIDMGKFKLLNQPYNIYRVQIDRDLNIIGVRVFFSQDRERYIRYYR